MESGLTWFMVLLVSAAASATMILIAMPWFRRYALARPNSRSSHREPTPQGGGAAVILSTLLIGWCGIALAGPSDQTAGFGIVTAACVLLMLAGGLDDVYGLSPAPRLAVQCVAVGFVIFLMPDNAILPMLPAWIERLVLFVAGVWFVNLVNFMDGIDWMTVAEVVPITGALILIGWAEPLPPALPLMAAALLGAMLGFAPFNRPVARLFLGDVGSLPIGLLLGWLLLMLASRGHLAAAILLPLYYLADATLTLAMRLRRGERVWEAHRSHFYQRAAAGTLGVTRVVGGVFVVNIALAALALLCVRTNDIVVSAASVAVGAALVAMLLASLARADNPLR